MNKMKISEIYRIKKDGIISPLEKYCVVLKEHINLADVELLDKIDIAIIKKQMSYSDHLKT